MIKDRRAPPGPPGEGKGAWLAALEQGANLLQTDAPMRGFDVYVVGFHCAKGEPDFQMEAHHFCRVVNDDLLQCVLFDGNTKDANLIGIEYIVSEAAVRHAARRRRGLLAPAQLRGAVRSTGRAGPARRRREGLLEAA